MRTCISFLEVDLLFWQVLLNLSSSRGGKMMSLGE
jgi:hypothetical protein